MSTFIFNYLYQFLFTEYYFSYIVLFSLSTDSKGTMDFRTLQQTDLHVSRLCFGTMTFGKPVEANEARRMLRFCVDVGINFLDTANIYQEGLSEAMLGIAMGENRRQFVLATKVRGKMGDGPWDSGLSRSAIIRAVENSLRRLRTDYIDVYYFHQPDYGVPLDESLVAMEQLVRQGKVRYPATSNYSSWQVCQMLSLADRAGYRPVSIAQQMYSLLARGIEQEFLPMAKELQVSTVAYNPLAAGLLTGKHTESQALPGTRFDGNSMYQDRYWHPEDFRAVEELKTIAQEEGRSLISLALNWMLHHTPVDSVILGASRLQQLEQNVAVAAEGPLSQQTVERCDEVWTKLRGPVPQYNR